VLVFPYRILDTSEIAYAVFQRNDDEMPWQAISGGGEDAETPLEAARREAWEEAGIAPHNTYVKLESCATIPVIHFAAFRDRQDMFVIPEFSFGVNVIEDDVRLSREHVDYAWLPYSEAYAILRWDSNKIALWELDRRLHVSRKTRPGK
jgi:dATP pyrophosphohydrolase